MIPTITTTLMNPKQSTCEMQSLKRIYREMHAIVHIFHEKWEIFIQNINVRRGIYFKICLFAITGKLFILQFHAYPL